MKENKKVRLRALEDIYIKGDEIGYGTFKKGYYPEENVKWEGTVFEVDRKTAKKLRDMKIAQAPSKYVYRGLRLSRKRLLAMIEETKEVEKYFEEQFKK